MFSLFPQCFMFYVIQPLPHSLANGRVFLYNVTCHTDRAEVLNDHGSCRDLHDTNLSCSLLLPAERCSCALTASNTAGTSPETWIWFPGASETGTASSIIFIMAHEETHVQSYKSKVTQNMCLLRSEMSLIDQTHWSVEGVASDRPVTNWSVVTDAVFTLRARCEATKQCLHTVGRCTMHTHWAAHTQAVCACGHSISCTFYSNFFSCQ